MKAFTRPLMGMTVLAFVAGLTACGSEEPQLVTGIVNVAPMNAVDGMTDERVKSVDPTLTATLVPDGTDAKGYTRVLRDPDSDHHWFEASAYPADDEGARQYANFKEFSAAGVGTLQEVTVDGYSWGYVGYEPNEDTLTPMAGVIARNTHGEVFVCAWSGDDVPDADLALDLANHSIELLKEACEYPGV